MYMQARLATMSAEQKTELANMSGPSESGLT